MANPHPRLSGDGPGATGDDVEQQSRTPSRPEAPTMSKTSGRGGRRPGAGRPRSDFSALRAEIIDEFNRELCLGLPNLLKKMFALAEGGFPVIEQKYEPGPIGPDGLPTLRLVSRTASVALPDRHAIQYLIDRCLGRPRQAVEVDVTPGASDEFMQTIEESLARIYGHANGALTNGATDGEHH
jgi:hypothetical protein